jgi:hypothetical protein
MNRSGSEKLDPSKKGGSLTWWQDGVFHFSRWQHWKIPVAALVPASHLDAASPGDRCTYARQDAATLSAIAAWQTKNRCSWGAL